MQLVLYVGCRFEDAITKPTTHYIVSLINYRARFLKVLRFRCVFGRFSVPISVRLTSILKNDVCDSAQPLEENVGTVA
jgi:hypothetical protein